MTRFLFWNFRHNGPDRDEILARIVDERSVDVIVLAESFVERDELADRLSRRGRVYHPIPAPHDLIQILVGYPADCFPDWVRDEGRLCLRRLVVPGHQEILLGAVHLVSGLHSERSERHSEAAPIAWAIRDAQRERGHARTILVGDFNLNPFDDGMICTDGFAAMTSRSLVKKYALYRGHPYDRLYNPIWSRMGRDLPDEAPGTYYWSNRRSFNIYWNFPDQVLVGHDLLDHFPDDQFRILTSIPDADGPRRLIRETPLHWEVEVSDHLPLLFDLDIPREPSHG